MAKEFDFVIDGTEYGEFGGEVTFVGGKEATVGDEFIGGEPANPKRRGDKLAAV